MTPNYRCKWCGMSSTAMLGLTTTTCPKSPHKRHEIYEGSEKSKYTCKWCGMTSTTLLGLTTTTCPKSPHKRHEPAL